MKKILILIAIFLLIIINLYSDEIIGIKIVDSESHSTIKGAHVESIINCIFYEFGQQYEINTPNDGMVYLIIPDWSDYDYTRCFSVTHPDYIYCEICFVLSDLIYYERGDLANGMIISKDYGDWFFDDEMEKKIGIYHNGNNYFGYIEVKILMKPIPYRFDD